MTPLALYSPLASWLLIALIVATVVLVLAPLWPRSPRPDVSDLASSAVRQRRDGDTRQGGAR